MNVPHILLGIPALSVTRLMTQVVTISMKTGKGLVAIKGGETGKDLCDIERWRDLELL